MRDNDGARGDVMGLVKTRRLAAMQKQQRAKAGMRPPCKDRKNRVAVKTVALAMLKRRSFLSTEARNGNIMRKSVVRVRPRSGLF